MKVSEPLSLTFVFHGHQPTANSDSLVRQIVENSYIPFLNLVSMNPWFKCCFHLSGSLIDRLLQLFPFIIDRLADLTQKGQVELLGGGYHEPLLPLLPAIDRRQQMKALQERLFEIFQVRPQGVWLAERFWEQSLVKDLSESGFSYTLVDEHGFYQTGFDATELSGSFITEDQGYRIRIFPISKVLRYLIPSADVGQVTGVLQKRRQSLPGSSWVFADDIEKFGAWPGCFGKVYENKWLENFFQMLKKKRSQIQLRTLKEAFSEIPPQGLAYLPATSYPELLNWSLPQDRRSDPGRPGNVRHFLVSYPEINLLHKRMLMASKTVHSLPRPSREIKELLWQSQSACSYYFGWFGGAFLPWLRIFSRRSAALAEYQATKLKREKTTKIEFSDFDSCGKEEIIARTDSQLLIFKQPGSWLLAWEDRETGFDLLGCMNLQSRFNGSSTNFEPLPFESFILPNHRALPKNEIEPGMLSQRGNYIVEEAEFSIRQNSIKVIFQEKHASKKSHGILIGKTFKISRKYGQIEVEFTLENVSDSDREFVYGFRLPFSVSPGTQETEFFLSFPELGMFDISSEVHGDICGIQELLIGYSSGSLISILFDRPGQVRYYPLKTELVTEGKNTVLLQGLNILFAFPTKLLPSMKATWKGIFQYHLRF